MFFLAFSSCGALRGARNNALASSPLLHPPTHTGSGNLDAIQLIKKPGGALRDSYLDEGFILDKRLGLGAPRRLVNPKIMIANTPMDTDKIKIYGARVRTDSLAKVGEIEAAERGKMKEKVEAILAHGANCFINRQLIYNYPEELFAVRLEILRGFA